MLRSALVLGLLCLAYGSPIKKKSDGAVDMPAELKSDEDVRQVFRFMVNNAKRYETKLRQAAPKALEALEASDPDAELEKMIEGMERDFEEDNKVFGKVLHGLGMLSDGIFKNLIHFKRSQGGCDNLATLAATMEGMDEKDAALKAAAAMSADLNCIADDFAMEEEAPIDQYKTSDITADGALDIVETIARQIIKTHEDGVKIYWGASTILAKLNPALKAKLDAAVVPKSSREVQITRLLRTLLEEINRRK